MFVFSSIFSPIAMEADQIENLHPSISNEPQTKKKRDKHATTA